MFRKLQKKIGIVALLALTLLGVSSLGYGYSTGGFGVGTVLSAGAQTTTASNLNSVQAAPNTIAKASTADFRLTIPSIGVNKEVAEDVSPADEAIYGPVITERIAHGLYTRKPDEAVYDGNVYLFAHRQGVVGGKDVGFFQDLHRLKRGDKAFVRYAGKTYTYEFVRSFVITPQDTWVYTARSDYPKLTLQTCENGEELRLMVEFRLLGVQ